MFLKHRHTVSTLSSKQRLKSLETECMFEYIFWVSTSGFAKDQCMLSMTERYVHRQFFCGICIAHLFVCFICLRPVSNFYSRDITSACGQSYVNTHVIMLSIGWFNWQLVKDYQVNKHADIVVPLKSTRYLIRNCSHLSDHIAPDWTRN